MGRRRRKTAVRRPVRTIPTIFNCPRCGRNAVRIEIDRAAGEATVHCGNCDCQAKLLVSALTEPVDVYGEFVDLCASGVDLSPKTLE